MENHRHWLFEAVETPASDQGRFDNGCRPVHSANEMSRSKFHHWLFGAGLVLADSAAAERLVNLWHAVVVAAAADAEQAFAESLVGSPKEPDLHFDIAAETCRIMMEIHYQIEMSSSEIVSTGPSFAAMSDKQDSTL